MPSAFVSLLPAIPLLPLLSGLVATRLAARRAAGLVTAGAAGSLALALAASVGLAPTGPHTLRLALPGDAVAFALTLRLDAIAAVMVTLVAFLGLVVQRFSQRHLEGDARQVRFAAWMSVTLAAVLTLVLAGNLLVLWLAWVATSLALHRLLLHHPERPGAVFAARKKFVVSRLGDLALLAALVLLHRHYGTWDFDPLFAAAAADPAPLPAVAFLLVTGAALKSAQFPFHSWLPDTMETPTPVSAFMHAGIINAGGFLLVRLHPLLVPVPAALGLLAVVGAVTAAFGAIVMLAQPGVKRALAYSTIAQMGFMLLQCGLGAWGLALLHIVAHSLYKAHAFLRAGSTVGAVPRAAIPLRTGSLVMGVLAAGLMVSATITILSALGSSLVPGHAGVFAVLLAFALGYGLARGWSASGDRGFRVATLGAAAGVAAGGLLLHAGAERWLGPAAAEVVPSPVVLAVVGVIFTALFFFQALLWRAGRTAVSRRLYVHALNGFYIGTLANRWFGRLWPRVPAS